MTSRTFPDQFRVFLTGIALLLAAALSAGPAMAKNPYARADETWISISGTVDAVTADSFLLDYGDGVITVEMDDGDRDADGYKLLAGDEVTVYGMVDDDFFEATTIEASSVYVEKLDTTFYASAADEEDYWVTVTTPIRVASVVVRGTVSSVAVDDEEFVLNTGKRKITVEVEEMPFNPVDQEGYMRIEKGDYVQVVGRIDNDLFEGRELVADSVIEITD